MKRKVAAMTEVNASIEGEWIGDTYGTHRAHIFIKIEQSAVGYKAQINSRIMGEEPCVFIGETALAHSVPINFPISQKLDDGSFSTPIGHFQITKLAAGKFSGDWEIGNAKGVFTVNQFVPVVETDSTKPYQLSTKDESFGTLRIERADVEGLIKLVEELVGNTAIVTEVSKNSSIKLGSVDYLAHKKHANDIETLNIFASQNLAVPHNAIGVNFYNRIESRVVIESPDERWARNTLHEISGVIRERSNKVLDFYRRHGLRINATIFLGLLVILPGYAIQERAIWVVSVYLFLILHLFIHRQASMTIINVNEVAKKSFRERNPTTFYLISTALSALASASAGLIAKNLLSYGAKVLHPLLQG